MKHFPPILHINRGQWGDGKREGRGGHDAYRPRYKLLGKKASSCRSIGVVESKKELIAFVGLFRAPGMMARGREREKEIEILGAGGWRNIPIRIRTKFLVPR